jgi:cytochrome oxidase Cu insertion factor (SCO1/SenC/PrrC family)
VKKLFSTFVVLSILTGCFGSPTEDGWIQFNGTEWPGAPAPDFILINQDGDEISLSDFENKIIVVAFTFTTCPDFCPMIEYNMNLAKDALGDSYGTDVVFLSISIDPLTDTPEKMKSYWHEGLGYEWNHLTHTDTEIIENVWASYAIIVDKTYIQAHTVDDVPINASDNMYEDLWIVLEHWNMFSENGERHVKTPSAINHIENILSQHTNISTQNTNYLNSNNHSLTINNGTDSLFLTIDSNELNENTSGWNLTLESLNSENISYNVTSWNGTDTLNEINGEHIGYWQLMIWDEINKTWENSHLDVNSKNLDELYNSQIKNIAIIKNELDNVTNLPIEIRNEDLCISEYVHQHNHYTEIIDEISLWCEFNLNETVMLERVSTHITTYIQSLNENNSEEIETEYTLGHSTVTLILDKEHNRRVAWTGYNWDYLLFVEDIQILMNE